MQTYFLTFCSLVLVVDAATNCQHFRVEKICNLPKEFLPTIDTTFYKKFVVSSGIPIISSHDTPDISLLNAARVILGIMERLKPEIAEALTRRQQRILMYGPNENSCSLPEQAGPMCKPSTGLGLTYSNVVSIPYIREKCEDRGHGAYGFLVHEFGHAVNSVFDEIDKRLQYRLETAYLNAKSTNVWPSTTYAMSNVAEYFTLCWTPAWYKINPKCQHDASFCSRDKCALRDIQLYGVVSSLLKNPLDNFLNLECSQQCDVSKIKKYSVMDDCRNDIHVDTLKMRNVATDRFLDSNAKGDSYTTPTNNGYYQKWKVTLPRTSGSLVQILNVATGLSLESDSNGKVFTSMWNEDNPNQLWKFTDDKTVRNVGTQGILSANGQGVVFTLTSKDVSVFQQWNVI